MLTLIYEEIYVITEEFYLVPRMGYEIGGGLVYSRELLVHGGETYRGIPRIFTGHRYVGYRIDGRALRSSSPQIVNVRANHTVRMVYIRDEQGPGISQFPSRPEFPIIPATPSRPGTPGGSAPPNGSGGSETPSQATPPGSSDAESDYGNYEFIKLPNVRRVRPGEVVTYTFSDFGNNWGIPLEQYTIMDRPDRGIDIIAVRLPAFTEGRGVTYTISYYTESGDTRRNVLAANRSASQAFGIDMPPLRNGDFITMLEIEFDMVPPGFAVGDTLQIDFRIWDRPPARSLRNIGLLSYRVDEMYREFVTDSASGTVILGGWFSSPLTGDQVFMKWYILMGLISGTLLIICLKRLVYQPKVARKNTGDPDLE